MGKHGRCAFDRASSLIRGNKMPTRCNRLVFIAKLVVCSTCFGAPLCPSSGILELFRWLLSVVLDSWVYRSLVWCGAVGYVSSLHPVQFAGCKLESSSIPQTGHITHSSTPDQRPVNQRAKYHRQQPSV